MQLKLIQRGPVVLATPEVGNFLFFGWRNGWPGELASSTNLCGIQSSKNDGLSVVFWNYEYLFLVCGEGD